MFGISNFDYCDLFDICDLKFGISIGTAKQVLSEDIFRLIRYGRVLYCQ